MEYSGTWTFEEPGWGSMRADTAAPEIRGAGAILSADPTEVEHFNNNVDIGFQIFVREYKM